MAAKRGPVFGGGYGNFCCWDGGGKMWHRRRRTAVQQSVIRKKCKLFGPMAEGFRTAREHDIACRGLVQCCSDNPYKEGSSEANAWQHGWELFYEA